MDEDNKQRGRISSRVNSLGLSLDVERTPGKVPGSHGLVQGNDEGERDDEHKPGGRELEEADGAVDDAPVARTVVSDGVPEGEDGDEPGDQEEEGSGLEAVVGGGRLGVGDDLLGVALVFDFGPGARDHDEEVLRTTVS